MAKVISIGYSAKFFVPDYLVTQFIEVMSGVQQIEGYPAETLKQVELEIKTPHPDLGREITQREQELLKKSEQDSGNYYKEMVKRQELEKELAAEKAKVEALIQRGVCGVVMDKLSEANVGEE